MAFLTPIEHTCQQPDCKYAASRELWDGLGVHQGNYCITHAMEHLSTLERDEAAPRPASEEDDLADPEASACDL